MKRLGLIAVALVLVGVGLVAARALNGKSGEDIYLEGKGQVGRHPFTTIAMKGGLTECPPWTRNDDDPDSPGNTRCEPTGPQDPQGQAKFCAENPTHKWCVTTPTTQPSGPTTTALFGGSGSQKVCDPEALITFLMANPSKAAAWVEALNADPSLEWSGGKQLTVADIPTYVRELTATFLTLDTRVTNHGYVNGKATPHQSILQAGTAVLVDKNGIPRVRCVCGNPLTRPHKVDNPNYVGECWPGCHDEPPCAPPGCSETTTTEPPTTTTEPSTTTTTTCVPGVVAGSVSCGGQTTTTQGRPDTPKPTTTIKKASPTTTQPKPTTTQPKPTTTQPQGTTTTRNPDCPPPGPVDCKP